VGISREVVPQLQKEATVTTTGADLERFLEKKTALLTRYRRDGAPVGTPVTIAVEGSHAFVRTFDKAAKMKRIRRDPNVEVAPSTLLGRPIGPSIWARVRLLGGVEAEHAARLIARRQPVLQGALVPLFHRLRRYRTIHMELTPIDDQIQRSA
jgi:PPOX class probable F420-dependent enzyme